MIQLIYVVHTPRVLFSTQCCFFRQHITKIGICHDTSCLLRAHRQQWLAGIGAIPVYLVNHHFQAGNLVMLDIEAPMGLEDPSGLLTPILAIIPSARATSCCSLCASAYWGVPGPEPELANSQSRMHRRGAIFGSPDIAWNRTYIGQNCQLGRVLATTHSGGATRD